MLDVERQNVNRKKFLSRLDSGLQCLGCKCELGPGAQV